MGRAITVRSQRHPIRLHERPDSGCSRQAGAHLSGQYLEYDPINSFHLHGNFFDYYPTGTRLEPTEFTDTVIQGQGQRGICELRFPSQGQFMFHAHKTEFADLGWMGFFDVVEDEVA